VIARAWAALPAAGISPADPRRVGRDGALALRVERRGGRSVVAASRSVLPLQVLAPLALPDPAAIEVDVGPGAHALLTTPSASRVYRAPGAPTEQAVALRVGAGAALEWVPDHTIPYAGAAYRQALHCELEDGGTLVLLDAFAAGRIARGEAWAFRHLESALTVRDQRGLLFHDRFVLGARGGAGLGAAEDHPYFATLVAVADRGCEAFAAAADARLAAASGARGGAAPLARRGVVVRCLAASAPALTDLLDALWSLARRELLELPPLALRKP
jgi:urease accessory protein